MISGIGGYGGSTSAGGFGGFGSPEGMAEDAVASGAMSEAEAYGGFDTPEGPGNLGGGGGGEGNLMGNYAAPTGNFQSGVSLAKQVKDNNIYANAVKSVMTALSYSPMQQAMRWGVSMLPEQMRAQTRTMSLDELAAGMKAMGPSFNMQPGIIQSSQSGRMNVPMSGSGAHLGIASDVIDIGGKNVHVGPGMPMSEDFFPGYGTNPFSGVAMADPGEHKNYIRKKKRGTEIAALIGP